MRAGHTSTSNPVRPAAVATVGMTRGPGVGASRFFTEADCRDVARRLNTLSRGGGTTDVQIQSWWRGGLRWGRNELTTSVDIRDNRVQIFRTINGAVFGGLVANDVSDAGLVAMLRRTERMLQFEREGTRDEYLMQWSTEHMQKVDQFSEKTFGLDEDTRNGVAIELIRAATEAGMLSAGYLEASAYSVAQVDAVGRMRYYPFTYVRYGATVRDPKGAGSGWAAADHWDWGKIDAPKLSALALEKCRKSRNPVRCEPGRYTAILEPQAVGDFVRGLFCVGERVYNELNSPVGPFWRRPYYSKLGERLVDERITISVDPTDPELAAPALLVPFAEYQMYARVSNPMTWFKNGVLVNLAHDRRYALKELGSEVGYPDTQSFRMELSGPSTTLDDMIAGTKRGIVVSRFSNIERIDTISLLYRGYTRDGLWLVEDGKVTKAIKNFVFTETILGALNRIEQFSVPQRVFSPDNTLLSLTKQPVIVPALKINDFSFTALTDAV